MNSRLQDLIARGYRKEDILKLTSFTDEELNAALQAAFKHVKRNCSSVSNPNALFVGGQPGCGKSSMSLSIKNKKGNILEINMDNFRMYHPKYLEIEKHIKNHWNNKKETINDSPGNDMAEMTNSFVGVMTDKLTELASKEKYNLLLEWGMREPESPLKTMNYLKENGYIVDVVFVATNKKDSLKACNLRGNIVNDSKHIIRQITKKFHDYCVESLPKSIDTIYNSGKEKCYDSLKIVDRYGKTLWDKSNNNQPGLIFHEYLNSGSTRDINHNFISIFDNICDE